MSSAVPAGLALQPRALRTLERTLKARSTHAFLLSGRRGAGTLDAALWLAQSALCPAGGGDGCDVCVRVDRRVHPDLLWLKAEGQQLVREQIDTLVEQLVRRPFEAALQVAVIEDADTLSATNPIAGNALLKVLEEPPGDVLFVLLGESPQMLLPTLRSRVIEVPFPALSDTAVRAWLVSEGLAESADAWLGIDVVVRLAAGDIVMAREFASGGRARQRHEDVVAVAQALSAVTIDPSAAADQLAAHAEAAGTQAAAAAEQEFDSHCERLPQKEAARFRNSRDSDGYEARVKRRARRASSLEIRMVLAELASWYRDIAAVAAGAEDTVRNIDRIDDLRQCAQAAIARRTVPALDAIEELPLRLTTNVELPLALGSLCAELAGLAEGRVRSRRTTGAGARSAQGLELQLS